MIFGNPEDAERDLAANIAFVRRIKKVNPAVEIVVQTYVPTPQRNGAWGDVEVEFPSTPDEWITDRWFPFLIRTDPQLPWLPPHVKRRIHDFETVMNSRWPTMQDMRLPALGPDAAEIAQQLAIRDGRLRFSRRIALGAKAGAPAPAAAGEPVMAAIRVSAREGYALWADTWDATPSPIVALEHRALLPWIVRTASAARDRRGVRHRPLDGASSRHRRGRLARHARDGGGEARTARPARGSRRHGASHRELRGRLVLCALTLGHIGDPAPRIREFARILAPGGTLLLTDFHPAAAAQGWRRTFRRDGQVYELENHAYTLDQLRDAAAGPGTCRVRGGHIGEPERALFDAARQARVLRTPPAARRPSCLTRWIRT